jgi:hypothetical protein
MCSDMLVREEQSAALKGDSTTIIAVIQAALEKSRDNGWPALKSHFVVTRMALTS